jgi:hypothetical protein
LGIGILLSSAYIFPLYFDFIKTNVARVGQTYAWAEGNMTDSISGTLNSFFLPFRADVHGSFAGSSLFLIAVILPVIRCFKVKIPPSVWALWGLVMLIFLYIQGDRTPIHRWVWEYFPFASSFRIAGRIAIMMPIFIMMLLAWVIKVEPISLRLRGLSLMVKPYMILAVISLFLMIVYFLSFWTIAPESSGFSPLVIRKVPFWIEILGVITGMTVLTVLAFHGAGSGKAKALGICLCLLTCIQVGTVLKYGTWVGKRRATPTYEQMQKQKRETLDYRYISGAGMVSSVVDTQLTHYFMEPFLGKIYTEIIPVSSQDEAYKKMRQERTPRQLFIEGLEPDEVPPITDPGGHIGESSVELVYSSFNRLTFRVISPVSAFLGLSYPYSGYWSAWINGHEADIYRANGAAHAIQIPEGKSMVDFRYFSHAAFWGVIISCTTLTMIGLYICFFRLNGVSRVFVMMLVTALGTGIFLLWYYSLYNGKNLETEYTWTYENPPPTPNLAYGKKTWISSSFRAPPWHFHSSRAIDGDRSPRSGFVPGPHQDNPALFIDLNREQEIKKIIIYKSRQGTVYIKPRVMPVNNVPLRVALSHDNDQWRTVASVTPEVNDNRRVTIVLDESQTARYLRISASGKCSLTLDEVEIYGPEG